MVGSILDDTRCKIGVPVDSDEDDFVVDFLHGINSTLITADQLGIFEGEVPQLTSKEQTWESLNLVDKKILPFLQSYVKIKMRLEFDPPQSSTMIDLLKKQADELEWRMRLVTEKN